MDRKLTYEELENRVKELEKRVSATGQASFNAVKDSETRYKSVFNNISSGVAIYKAVDGGTDFEFIGFNPAAERIERTSAGDVIGRRLTSVFPGVEEFGLLDVLRRVWKTGVPEHHPISIYEDNRIRGWRENYVFRLPAGEVVAAYSDVTEQKRAEEKVKQTRDFLQTVIDGVNDSLMVINRDYTIALANKTALKMAGIRRLDNRMTCHQLSHGSDKPCRGECHICPLRAVIDTRLPQKVEHIHKDAEGRDINVELVASPIFDEHGEVVQIVEMSSDITEEKKSEKERQTLQAQLQQTQKLEAIGTLAGGIAHDFNNILSGIFGYSQLARNHIDEPEKAVHYIDQSVLGAQRASELTRQILTFARQTEYSKKPLEIYLEVNEALKLLRSSIPSTIEIKKTLESRTLVLADPIKIHQVIMNLCTNAYHAMRKTGGCLTVSLRDIKIVEPRFLMDKKIFPGEYICLEVRDTGHGMDEKILERAFDPYFTTKKIGQGTGLGLSLVQAIVEEHDAFVDVQSAPDEGTCFFLYFPAVKGGGRKPQMGASKYQSYEGRETIMVVDDEEALRDVYKNLLEDYGYKVLCFENGEEALGAFKVNSRMFDMVLTDMTMPKLAGDKLSRAILKIRPDIPIVLLTGFSDAVSRDGALALGIREYLQKPFENKELLTLMREIFDSPSPVTT